MSRSDDRARLADWRARIALHLAKEVMPSSLRMAANS
jgi:hypothetical protein